MNCERCRRVWYCSTECQQLDWPNHHVNCVPTLPSPPSGSTSPPSVETQRVQALVLLAHSPARHWRMINVHTSTLPAAGGPHPIPQFDAELNLGERPGHVICLHDVGGSPLSQPYQIFFRNSFLNDQSPINLGVRSLHPEITYLWAGNIVIFKFDGSRRQRYRHMEQSDIVQIAQFFRTYPN
ncbi:hypothetical protein FS749_000582 [Ceratobasidium sp. UAMH 11750]|nr:hypothetical protein FS749_000582 [Ceratobasidium sp. UAMH 11750]